ncbi:hypothetical protein JZU69_01100 [bacterium]|nr:hypothetical protein [bacterium]
MRAMAATTPTTEPAQLIAGDTARWLKTDVNYPASGGWVLTYTLLNTAGRISITAIAEGDDYLVNAEPATTTAWPPGNYQWRAKVTHANGEAYTVAGGSMRVLASFEAATLDTRSHARKVLANIEAFLENPNSVKAASYEIAGRKLTNINITELLKMRDRYRLEAMREDDALRIASGDLRQSRGRIQTRFGLLQIG